MESKSPIVAKLLTAAKAEPFDFPGALMEFAKTPGRPLHRALLARMLAALDAHIKHLLRYCDNSDIGLMHFRRSMPNLGLCFNEFVELEKHAVDFPVVVIVMSDEYWAKGKTLEEALTKLYKEGAQKSAPVLIRLFTGPIEDVWVNSNGEFEYYHSGHMIGLTDALVKVSIVKKKNG